MIDHTNFEVNDLHPLKDGELSGSDRIIVAHNPRSPDRPVSSATVDQVQSAVNGGAKRYVALLTQSGTNAPTATVLENSLVATPVFTYNSAGNYNITIAGNWDPAKTLVLIGNQTADGPQSPATAFIETVSASFIRVATYTLDFVDDELLNTPIEIRVYP